MQHLKIDAQEEAFVHAFISSEKQSRYLEMLASSKKRHSFLDRLNHNLDYNPTFAKKIPQNQQSAETIGQLLRQNGASNICHVISSNPDWDNQNLPLQEALNLVVGSTMGTVLCCLEGRLAYFESEDVHERYLLKR